MDLNIRTSFFASSLEFENIFQSLDEFNSWFDSHCKPEEFSVKTVSITNLDQWVSDESFTSLKHQSGKFFSIEGINVKTNFGSCSEWDQPIINQPEIGILGFITKNFNGIRYFLVQAKMEPGNINTLQLSPSLQATKSNFTQVHKGKKPLYLEYFNGEKKVKVLIDQLQTEQGGRFLKKRNRNIIIEVFDDVELQPDFCWLTLGELKKLLAIDNCLNMDARSVLSTIPLVEDSLINYLQASDNWKQLYKISNNGERFIRSYISKDSLYSIDELISWYTSQKNNYELTVTKKPLCKLKNWRISENSIFNNERFFSVIGVKVMAGTREVKSWMQPLIKDDKVGLLAFVFEEINGIVHFLVQAKVEPGNLDIVELSPTVTCSNYLFISNEKIKPFLFDEIFDTNNNIIYDQRQSEEGGRFYRIQNRNMIVELRHKLGEMPSNYIWMTLSQIKEFMRYGMFNIEARSIISSIKFFE
jgi:dTDP-4-dehydro-6-deoxy-alpha-D-glucopyranose 2,3-dehydratase